MATRKAPTGAKHDRCIGHVEHPYPAKGMLCYGAVIGAAGMIDFADHLAATAAEHRAADLARVETMHLAARPGAVQPTVKAPRKRRTNLIAGAYVAPEHVPGNSFSGPAAIRTTAADAAKLAELVARFRAMRGLPAEPTFARAPVRKAPRVKVERPAPVVAESRCYVYLHTTGGQRRCMVEPDGHDGVHEYDRIIRPMMGEPYEMAPEPDTYAAAVELAETRPDPCEACGHPAHGATCANCDYFADEGTYAPCSIDTTFVEPVTAETPGAVLVLAEPASDQRSEWTVPEPVLSVPAPVQPSARPTCERCGQVFRVKGAGAEWHRVNRPDCARVAVAV